MTSQLLFHKPDDPTTFLLSLLTDLKRKGAKPLLTASDLETMFDMFDVSRRGVLTKKQAFSALRTVLGAEHALVREREADAADSKTLLNKEQFVASLLSALEAAVPCAL